MSEVVNVNFRLATGETVTVAGSAGDSLMECAVSNGISGVIGECGGWLACATCHGYVSEEWYSRLSPPLEQEMAMLEGCVDVRPTSRLTCQVKLDPSLNGLGIELPQSQT